MSRMSRSCNYIEQNIQKVSGYGFLVHPKWETEVEMFANRLKEMISQAEKEEDDEADNSLCMHDGIIYSINNKETK